MDCKKCMKKIEVINALTEKDKRQVSAHITKCNTCHQYYHFSLSVEPTMRNSMRNVTTPILLRGQIISQLPQKISQKRKIKLYENFLAYPSVG